MSYNREEYKEKNEVAIKATKTLKQAQEKFFPSMNIKTFKNMAKEFGLFTPNQSKFGTNFKDDYPKLYNKKRKEFLKSLEENVQYQSNKLRTKLLYYDVFEKKCYCCGNTTWNR